MCKQVPLFLRQLYQRSSITISTCSNLVGFQKHATSIHGWRAQCGKVWPTSNLGPTQNLVFSSVHALFMHCLGLEPYLRRSFVLRHCFNSYIFSYLIPLRLPLALNFNPTSFIFLCFYNHVVQRRPATSSMYLEVKSIKNTPSVLENKLFYGHED
jgi:hypothetical protein